MIAKLIGSRAAAQGRREEARKTGALIAYAVDLLPLSPDIDLGIGRRLDYVTDLHDGEALGEKVRTSGTRNLAGRTLEELQAEMMALAAHGRCQKSPIVHIVVSWRRHENPTDTQVEETVEIVMEELGGPDLQVVWAVHDNTPNIHVHLVINRVRPSDFKVCQLGDSWLIDTLHQAVARIEHRQGWAPEPNALYEVTPDGATRDRVTGRPVRSADGKSLRRKGDRARDAELRRQQMPAARAREIIQAAQSWADLHRQLAGVGIRYVQKGSGAVLRVDGHPHDIKVSTAVRGSSHGKLERRLGPFVPGPAPAEIHEPAFAAHKRLLKKAKAHVRAHRRAVRSVLDAARDRIFLDRLVRAPGREASAALRADSRLALADLWTSATRYVRSHYDEALRRIGSLSVPNAQSWEARNRPDVPTVELPAILLPAHPAAAALAWEGCQLEQHQRIGVELVGRDVNGPAFADFDLLLVAREDGPDLADALELAGERWGHVQIVATRAACQKAEEMARRQGLPLVAHVAAEAPGTTPSLPARQEEIAAASRAPVPDAALQAERPASSTAAPEAAPAVDRRRAEPVRRDNGKSSPLPRPSRPRTHVEIGRAYVQQKLHRPLPTAPGSDARATRPDLSKGPAASGRPSSAWRPLETNVPSGQSPAPGPSSEAVSTGKTSSLPPGTPVAEAKKEAMPLQPSSPVTTPMQPPTPAPLAPKLAQPVPPANRASTPREASPVAEAGGKRAPVAPPPASSGLRSGEVRAPANPPPAASVAQPNRASGQPAEVAWSHKESTPAPAPAVSQVAQPARGPVPPAPPASRVTETLNRHPPSPSAGGAADAWLPHPPYAASGHLPNQPGHRPQPSATADHLQSPDHPAPPASAPGSPSVAAPDAPHRSTGAAATDGDPARVLSQGPGDNTGNRGLAADDHVERDPVGFEDDPLMPAKDRHQRQGEWDRMADEEEFRHNESWGRERSPVADASAEQPDDPNQEADRKEQEPAPGKPRDPALRAHLQAQRHKGRGR